jgi:hypothetical protein
VNVRGESQTYRFCPNCGTKAIEGSNFCAACGQPVAQSQVSNGQIAASTPGDSPRDASASMPSSTRPRPTRLWWATLAGLGVAVIGLFLDWATLTVPGLTTAEVESALGSGATATGIQTDDGKLVLVLAIIAAVALVLFLNTSSRPWTTVAGVATVALIAVSIYDQFNVPDFHPSKGVGASAGIGLYVCAVGGLMAAFGIQALRREAKENQDLSPLSVT